MSRWEIEGLIEYGIILVDKTDRTNEEKIKLIGNLYAIQQQFDCSFTNFRVMPILLKSGYTRTIDYKEHPDYKGNESYFEKLLEKDDIEFIYRDIKEEWSETNKMVAYLDRDTRKIYIDYGSPLRKAEGALEVMNVYDLGIYLIREAHKRQDKGLVYDWTAFLLHIGPHWLDKKMPVEELINSHFEEIKRIWSLYDYSDYEPISESLAIHTNPSEEEAEYVDMIIGMGGLKGNLLKWFLSR
ncbi:hypothetical protein [Chitinophaga sp. CF418]|uniref:hypothetical protein n=1 Tax=Chitinophaga sp. CF418 TaxID=1855287 RepID=UPI0009162C9B|nr:hypothetical protein [Chitinophaga sp. CF418]SHN33228.1 hypothetical protein SAMN05216311_109153 [Chitinophaga sp. CF418]